MCSGKGFCDAFLSAKEFRRRATPPPTRTRRPRTRARRRTLRPSPALSIPAPTPPRPLHPGAGGAHCRGARRGPARGRRLRERPQPARDIIPGDLSAAPRPRGPGLLGHVDPSDPSLPSVLPVRVILCAASLKRRCSISAARLRAAPDPPPRIGLRPTVRRDLLLVGPSLGFVVGPLLLVQTVGEVGKHFAPLHLEPGVLRLPQQLDGRERPHLVEDLFEPLRLPVHPPGRVLVVALELGVVLVRVGEDEPHVPLEVARRRWSPSLPGAWSGPWADG